MDRIHAAAPLSVCIIAIQLTLPSLARADDTPRLELKYSDIESEQDNSPLQRRECTPRYMVGPSVGIPLGLGTAGLGSAFVFLGTVPNSSRLSNRGIGIAIAGAIMIPAGLAAFIYSSVKAAKNRKTRQSVCKRRPLRRLSRTDPTREIRNLGVRFVGPLLAV